MHCSNVSTVHLQHRLFQFIAAILMLLISPVNNSESKVKAFAGCITAMDAVATILSAHYGYYVYYPAFIKLLASVK